MNSIEKEILLYNYWEHVKAGKELSFILPPENEKRKKIESEAILILEKINSNGNT